MVDAAKAFAKEPPKRPLDDLTAIVEDFQWRYVKRKKTDQVIVFCARATDFGTATRRAVEARDVNGKHHNHQSKVDIHARRMFGRKIIRRQHQIQRLVGNAENPFDALHDLLDEIKPFGIGPVTVYDVAVRLGAYLEVEPTSVYMHAGVRQGFRALVEAMDRQTPPWDDCHEIQMEQFRKIDKVPVECFPKPLNKMRADDVEDILCTYRQVFETWGV